MPSFLLNIVFCAKNHHFGHYLPLSWIFNVALKLSNISNLEHVWKNLKNGVVSGCMGKCSKNICFLILATDIYFKHICQFWLTVFYWIQIVYQQHWKYYSTLRNHYYLELIIKVKHQDHVARTAAWKALYT